MSGQADYSRRNNSCNTAGPDGRVHYLALDMSPPLLLTHLDILRDVCADELRAGRLNVAVVLSDMHEASKAVSDVRQEFWSRGISFLPDNIPLLEAVS
jgi:hypothetical protein